MHRLRLTLPLGLLVTAVPLRALGADYYVAPGGSGSTCTMAAPCGRVEDGQTRATAGDTVWIRGGTYTFAASATVGVGFSKSGGSNNPIRYFAYMNEIPVFDLSNGTPNARVTGFSITGSWIHIRGLEVRGVQQYMSGQDSWGVRLQGSNNVVERVVSHHNEAPGFFITSGGNNTILNCDSHHNYDQLENGGSGDGFGCHSNTGGNVMRGCRAFNNSDDGYDFINAPGVCTVEQSWAWSNGYVPDTTTAAGNGAGFKAGGFGAPAMNVPNPVPRHVVRQCVAFRNRAQGFYANHHPGGIDFLNNTALNNPTNYNMLADQGASNHTLRNNIAMGGTAISNLSGGTETFNSWTLSVTVTNADFLSVTESEAGAPRQADGSLPNVNFARLAANSDLIDKGTNVGLPYTGSAPDLGAFETGIVGPGGMGGMAGMGGRGGNGGAGSGNMGGAGMGGAGRGGAGAGGMAGSGAGMGGRGGNAGMAGAGNAGGAGNMGGMAGAGNTSGMAGAGNTGGGNAGGMAGAGNVSGMGAGGMSGGNAGGSAGTIAPGGSGGSDSGGIGGNTAGTGGTLVPGGGAGMPATGGTVTGTGGAATGGASTTGGTTGTAGSEPGGDSDAVGEDGGCTCRIVGPKSQGGLGALAFLSLLTAGALRRGRRRKS